ncbi:fimbrial protein [Citrobacter portucalensis]|uniref:Fimbrial protein n=1 Tax=Citrobacter portucalensis TaxID=1639133 RepID=A0AAW5WC31_9ENTR|nr:fimbrial protein [Citrobacter portucalensis]MCX9004736.1 fimbrial protein [Citrobacter portucalensis]
MIQAVCDFLRKKILKLIISICVSILFVSDVIAVTTVTVKATVMAAPACTINNNKTIEVNFSEVVTSRIDGGDEYLRLVDYVIYCKDARGKPMNIMIAGNPASFNNNALQADITDLGIELHVNGNDMEINKWYGFVYPHKPEIKAVPVKRSGSKLPTGNFSVGATLKVEYP